eukprot:SAG11_NODE_357_length_10240_cov_4.621142_5_plen_281_part_00
MLNGLQALGATTSSQAQSSLALQHCAALQHCTALQPQQELVPAPEPARATEELPRANMTQAQQQQDEEGGLQGDHQEDRQRQQQQRQQQLQHQQLQQQQRGGDIATMEPWSSLAPDVVALIMDAFGLRDLHSLARTCRFFNTLVAAVCITSRKRLSDLGHNGSLSQGSSTLATQQKKAAFCVEPIPHCIRAHIAFATRRGAKPCRGCVKWIAWLAKAAYCAARVAQESLCYAMYGASKSHVLNSRTPYLLKRRPMHRRRSPASQQSRRVLGGSSMNVGLI